MTTMVLLLGAVIWAAITMLVASFMGHGWVRARRQPASAAAPVPPVTDRSPSPGPSADAASPGEAMPAYGVGELRPDGLAMARHDRKAAQLIFMSMGLVPVVVGVWVVRTATSLVGGVGAIVLGLYVMLVWPRHAAS